MFTPSPNATRRIVSTETARQTLQVVLGGKLEVDDAAVMSFVLLLETVEDQPVTEIDLDSLFTPARHIQTLHRLTVLLPDHHRVRVDTNADRRTHRDRQPQRRRRLKK